MTPRRRRLVLLKQCVKYDCCWGILQLPPHEKYAISLPRDYDVKNILFYMDF